jgi:hypothetical protein
VEGRDRERQGEKSKEVNRERRERMIQEQRK